MHQFPLNQSTPYKLLLAMFIFVNFLLSFSYKNALRALYQLKTCQWHQYNDSDQKYCVHLFQLSTRFDIIKTSRNRGDFSKDPLSIPVSLGVP